MCGVFACVHARGALALRVQATAARGSDLKQAIACCENIIASVYYCFGVKQWECCVSSAGIEVCSG